MQHLSVKDILGLMRQIVLTEVAGAVDKADRQLTAPFQDTVCLGQHVGSVIHEADSGDAQGLVETVIRKRQCFGDSLYYRDASFFRIG
jgi:hypothetical protein